MDISDVKVGKTKVVVKKRDENGKVSVIKEGIVLQRTSSFVRVFDPRKGSGDAGNGEYAELYPWASNSVWTEPAGETEEKINIPIVFRS